MTQEEKQLLFRDLCGRLPYDVIVQETFQDTKRDVPIWDCGPHYIKDHLEKVKPYLRLMSSMTEDERKEYELLANHCIVTSIGFIHLEAAPLIDWLNKNYFDYRGLIPMGLALEAPEGMYENK